MVSREVEVVDARRLPSRVRATLAGVGRGGPRGADPTRARSGPRPCCCSRRPSPRCWRGRSPCTCSTARHRSTRRWRPCSSSTAPWCGRSGPAPGGWPPWSSGMSIAWLVGSLVGVTWWSMVVVMFVALLIGRWRRLGDHGIQVPTMVLLSLITVNGTDTEFTYLTIVETVLGGVVGVAVNAVVLAPMHLDEPRDALRDLTSRVQDVLGDIADRPARGLGRRPGPPLVPPRDRPRRPGAGGAAGRGDRPREHPVELAAPAAAGPDRLGRLRAHRRGGAPRPVAGGRHRPHPRGRRRRCGPAPGAVGELAARPTPTSSTRWGRRSRTSGCGPTSPVVPWSSTSTGRSRCSTR